ncbi:MAG: YhgE/Pip domain-containing protein [Bifidobacteriaceae bacterium]|jgi:putative membrane protein|nr:YhgE/Pip domain-containing protein [Bifidobacteriaceae bacterium]
MKNVFRIFARDVKRLFTVPAAWIIVVGLCITPALYAWFNIVGFWDPYGNTQSITVAVADEDKGASSDLVGTVNIGSQIVTTLKKNDQIGWKFVTRSDAMHEVKSGQSYAAIVIPKDFSENLLSITSGHFTRPKLQYYVNEKLNAIAPKVTDTGASTIDNQVNATFSSTVSKTVVSTLKTKLGDATGKLDAARSDLGSTLETSQRKIETAQKSLKDMATDVNDSRGKIRNVKATLKSTRTLLKDAGDTATQTGTILQSVSKTSTAFSSSALSTLNEGSTLLSSISASSNASIGDLSSVVLKAQGRVGGTLATVQSIAHSNSEIIANLTGLTNEIDLGSYLSTKVLGVLGELKEQNIENTALLNDLVDVNTDVGNTTSSLATTSDTLDSAIKATTKNGATLSSTLSSSTIPTLTGDISSLGVTSGQLAGGLTSQIAMVDQSQGVLDQLDSTLKNTTTALKTASTSLGDVADDMGTATTDIDALGTSAAWEKLMGLSDLNATEVAKNLSSPAQLKQKTLFPVATYGSAMAPLFTNLSLWIGAFVLVVILKLEVDREGIDHITTTQSYMGRWLLMAGFSAVQAAVVCIGDLIIGVQTVSPVAFVATGVLVALAYLSIIYALSKSLAHVGKGICVLLVMLQIPGASGLYPIEMMPDFFRVLYPLMPFTYGIDAMRETIGGFYDGHYGIALGKLSIFVALAFIIGIAARKYLINLNRLFADELDQTEIFVGEKAEVGEHSYRLSQIIHALVDKNEYRQDMIERAHAFSLNYRKMRRGALVVGFIVPFTLALVFSLTSSDKPVVLGLWVVWVLLIIGFLLTIEYIRDSISRQVSLGNMPEADIRTILRHRYAQNHRRHGKLRGFRARHSRASAAGDATSAGADTRTGTYYDATSGTEALAALARGLDAGGDTSTGTATDTATRDAKNTTDEGGAR